MPGNPTVSGTTLPRTDPDGGAMFSGNHHVRREDTSCKSIGNLLTVQIHSFQEVDLQLAHGSLNSSISTVYYIYCKFCINMHI